MEDFATFSVIGLPLMMYTFFHSIRVRLPEFRKKIYIVFGFIFITLFLNTMMTFFNKPLYYFVDDNTKQVSYQYHFIKELSDKLKDMGIKNITAHSNNLQLRLKFYGIEKGGNKKISTEKIQNASEIKIHIIGNKNMVFYIG